MAASEALKKAIADSQLEDENGGETPPEDETPAEPETPPAEPAPEPEAAPDDAAQLAAGLAAEDERHEAAIAELMGVAPPLPACPMCSSLGYFHPAEVAPKAHAKYRTCQTCNGLGEVLTGSRKQGQQAADCPGCAGRGYLELLEQPPPAPVPGMVAPPPAEPEPVYGVPTWMGDPALAGNRG